MKKIKNLNFFIKKNKLKKKKKKKSLIKFNLFNHLKYIIKFKFYFL